jgi:hypothetical protein
LVLLYCINNPLLSSLDLRNGTNTNIPNTNFNILNNPSLSCVNVDNVVWSTNNWTNIDAGTGFSANCFFPPFQKVYGDALDNSYSKVIKDGSEYYVLGQTEPSTGAPHRATVTRLNASGNLLWTKRLDIASVWNDAILTPTGDLLVIGSTLPFDAATKSLLGVLTNSGGGSFSCLRSYDEPGRDFFYRIVKNPNPESAAFPYYILGSQNQAGATATTEDVVLINVDANCNFNWKKIYTSAFDDEFFRDLEAMPNGDLLLAGNNENLGLIFKTDNTGSAFNGVQIPQLTFVDIGLESTGGIYAAANNLPNGEAHILKFDQDLLLQWDIIIPQLNSIRQVWEGMAGKGVGTGKGDFDGQERDVMVKFLDNGPSLAWVKYLHAGSGFTGGSSWPLPNMEIAFTDSRVFPGGFGGSCAFISVSDLDLMEACLVTESSAEMQIVELLPDGPVLPPVDFWDVPIGANLSSTTIDWLEAEVCTNTPCAISLDVTFVDSCGHIQVNSTTTGPQPYNYQWCSGETSANIDVQLPCGPHIFCVTVTCGDGSTATASQTIVVADNIPPTAVCALPSGVDLDANCMYNATVGMIDGGSFDNCQIQSMSVSPSVLNGCGVFPIMLIVEDWCNNKDTCTTEIQTIEVVPPTIVCPPNLTVHCDDDLNPNTTGFATAIDNCDPNPVITYTDVIFGQMPCDGLLQRTWTARDSCGNESSCIQNILVFDNIPPVLTNWPPDITVNGTYDATGACSAFVQLVTPTATDNCDPSVTLTNNINNTNNASGIYPGGQTTVIWTATDSCGNSAICSFNVIVECNTCVCAAPDLNLTTGSTIIPLSCNETDTALWPILSCPVEGVTISGSFGCIDPATGAMCEETPVNWTMEFADGTVSTGVINNAPIIHFHSGLISDPGAYSLTFSTLCPGATDSCICKVSWIQELCDTLCPDNIVQNGMFSSGIPPGSDQSIQFATNWGSIWTGGSTGDFFNTTTAPPSFPVPMPVTQGNFGAMWCRLQGNDAVWREGIMNELGTQIPQNSGCYELSFKLACLYDNLGPSYPSLSVFGVTTSGFGTGTIVNGNTPTNLGMFPAGTTVELGAYLIPAACDKNYQTITFNFDSSILPSAGISHIFFTRTDGISGAEFIAIDDVCLHPGMCPPYSCCADLEAFCQTLDNEVTISIDNDSCKATVNIDDLPDCDYLEYIDWGDGTVDAGPFNSGSMTMHTFPGSGVYEICYLAIELDTAGFICFEKIVCDTIDLDCNCTCGTYSDLSYRPEQGAPNIPTNCGDILTAQCDGQIPWTLGGNFLCDGDICPDSSQMFWMLMKPVGSSSGTMTASPGFNMSIPGNEFNASGTYQLILKAVCGQDTCYCEFIIEVDCDSCCTDLDAFCQNVENAVTISLEPDTCKATFNIGDLGDCNDYIENVDWGDTHVDNGPFFSNEMLMHIYPGSGLYEICYLAIELDTAGLICFEKIICDTIDIPCPTVAVNGLDYSQRISLFPNPTKGEVTLNFENGSPGHCKSQISDLWGRPLISEQLEAGISSHNVSLDKLPSGIYFIKITENGLPVWIEKIVKQ